MCVQCCKYNEIKFLNHHSEAENVLQDFVFFFKVGEGKGIFAESHFYGEGRSAEFFDEPILKAAARGNFLGKCYVVAACL